MAEGDVEGLGRWELSAHEDGTQVLYYWNIRTTQSWMNLVTPIAWRIFNWDHDEVMRQGGEGMARHLNAKLLVNE